MNSEDVKVSRPCLFCDIFIERESRVCDQNQRTNHVLRSKKSLDSQTEAGHPTFGVNKVYAQSDRKSPGLTGGKKTKQNLLLR